MSKIDEFVVQGVGAVLAAVIGSFLIAALAVYRGWALAKLWGWFVAPNFGAPALSTGAAAGLYLAWSLWSPPKKMPKREYEELTAREKTSAALSETLMPVVAVAAGWLIRRYLGG